MNYSFSATFLCSAAFDFNLSGASGRVVRTGPSNRGVQGHPMPSGSIGLTINLIHFGTMVHFLSGLQSWLAVADGLQGGWKIGSYQL